MVTHLSARLVWHDAGWNGRICENPVENTSCVMHEHIREGKDDAFEREHAGEHFDDLEPDSLPPCSRDPGAYASTGFTHLHTDPLEYRPSTTEELPPYSFCTAPYGELRDESTASGWVEEPDEQEEVLENFFGQLDTEISLVFFYVKDGHPLSEDHSRVIVGVGRIDDTGDQLYFPEYDEPVWSRRVTQNYPEEGVRLPYQEYLKAGHDVDEILCTVPEEETDPFSYVANHVSDDTAIGVLERLLESLRAVKRGGHVEGDWDEKIEWVETALSEVWDNRGMYPGLEGVLNYLEADGTGYQRRVLSPMNDRGENQLEHVVGLLDSEEEAEDPFGTHEFIIAQQNWQQLDDDDREVLKTLAGFDLTADEIQRVMDSLRYGETTVPVTHEDLRENLYLLSEQDQGNEDGETITFETIDRGLRVDPRELERPPPGFLMPVPQEDRRRVRALLRTVLETAAQSGDTLLSLEEAVTRVEQHLPEERQCSPAVGAIEQDIDFYKETLVVTDGEDQTTIALPKLDRMEEETADTIRDLATATLDVEPVDWRAVLDEILGTADTTDLRTETEEAARAEKTEALETLYRSRISVLMGGAGTGKTTVVSAFLDGLEQVSGRHSKLLLAPTGKARVRLEEVTAGAGGEVEAKTIHQFLMQHGWLEGGAFRLRDEGDETGGAQTVIVDEASMIPMDLMATLLRALDLNRVKRLVFVGDPNQLPPIGPGRPFFDIIQWMEEEASERVAELEQRVRYRSEAGSARDLAEVYAGETPELDDEILSQIALGEGGVDLDVRFWDDIDGLFEELGQLLTETITDDGTQVGDLISAFDNSVGYDSSDENIEWWQILSPTNIDQYGTQAINRRIQQQFRGGRQNDSGIAAIGDEQFVPGDKVIHTQNDTVYSPYSDSWEYVANGEIGVVSDTFSDDYSLHVRYPAKEYPLSYNSGELRNESKLNLAYGLTVHKAQGSDFETVFFILPQDAPTLSRELLYTGLTRYRENLVLLIEQDTSNLYELSKPEASEIRRRNTALFERSIRTSKDVPYPEKLIHRTNDGTLVRSKSEVVIANLLDEFDVTYEYEERLSPSGTDSYRLPDFTVHYKGDVYYWEHLGMLHVPEYRQKWEQKEQWYREHGLEDQLITSRDTPDGAIDSTEIRGIIQNEILSE